PLAGRLQRAPKLHGHLDGLGAAHVDEHAVLDQALDGLLVEVALRHARVEHHDADIEQRVLLDRLARSGEWNAMRDEDFLGGARAQRGDAQRKPYPPSVATPGRHGCVSPDLHPRNPCVHVLPDAWWV